MLNRGFIGGLFVAIMGLVVAGIVWWAFTQNSSTTVTSAPSGQTGGIPVVFTYAVNKTEFPFGLFLITSDARILGANYVRPRNTADTVYRILGSNAGTPLAQSCHWAVNATIQVANPKFDNASYADIDPTPSVAVADITNVVPQGEPRQVCTTP